MRPTLRITATLTFDVDLDLYDGELNRVFLDGQDVTDEIVRMRLWRDCQELAEENVHE